ncbi:MAG: ASKHA domain-containing protein [Lentisphaeria bacterium]|jgi:uncharacterized 2Fe-2S/4Fe-4S cluster protein (DUF4445 family)
MPLVTFQPSGKTVDVSPGTELMDAARRAGVVIAAPCGGKGTCGKCLVHVRAGEVASDSLGALSQATVKEGFVLACKTKVKQTPVVVEVLEQIGRAKGRFLDSADNLKLVAEELIPRERDYEPLATKHHTLIPAPRLQDGLADADRLSRQLQTDFGETEVRLSLYALRKLAAALRTPSPEYRGDAIPASPRAPLASGTATLPKMVESAGGEYNGEITVTVIRRPGHCLVMDVEPGDTMSRHYGIAVDIGTTTIAVQLVYLPLGTILGTGTEYNDQVDCGLDVISRINYAKKPERLEELRQRVVATINRLLRQVLASEDLRPADVVTAVLSGNTTMTHLLLGLPPEFIRLEPYTPTVMAAPEPRAGDLGLEIHPDAPVVLSPAVGSYVGGDITAGLLCTDLAADRDEVCLFIDIGTNGEVVIGNRDFLLACACSAGPAFEGGGIDCGMRAAHGAIDHVAVDARTGAPTITTIGGEKPKGICGSGMISLLSNLLQSGWLDAAGKLDRTRPSPYIHLDGGRHARYLLAPAEASGTGKPVSISELDIDNLIRAKAAIYSACAIMLKQVGLTFNDIARFYIAGGFGRSLVLEHAKVIGLIPDLPAERFHYIGNSSLMGSYMILLSDAWRQKQAALANRMTYLELSTDPGYMDEYTGALFLPHTDASRFPTVKLPT